MNIFLCAVLDEISLFVLTGGVKIKPRCSALVYFLRAGGDARATGFF
jgi:hypothetical protein